MKPLPILVFALALLILPGCQTMQTMMDDVRNSSLFQPFDGQDDESEQKVAVQNEQKFRAPFSDFCPKVEVVDELSSLSEFTDMSMPEPYNLISRVNLSQVESSCTHEDNTIVVDIKLAFESTLGPQGRQSSDDQPFFSYPFFVAVLDPGGEIMAKEVFSASMTYNPGEERHTYFESLRQIIPHEGSKHQASLHQVLLGFQLNQAQLDYNRAFMRQAAAERVTPSAVPPAASYAKTPVRTAAVPENPREPISVLPSYKPETPPEFVRSAEASPPPASEPAPVPVPDPEPQTQPPTDEPISPATPAEPEEVVIPEPATELSPPAPIEPSSVRIEAPERPVAPEPAQTGLDAPEPENGLDVEIELPAEEIDTPAPQEVDDAIDITAP